MYDFDFPSISSTCLTYEFAVHCVRGDHAPCAAHADRAGRAAHAAHADRADRVHHVGARAAAAAAAVVVDQLLAIGASAFPILSLFAALFQTQFVLFSARAHEYSPGHVFYVQDQHASFWSLVPFYSMKCIHLYINTYTKSSNV